jgi:hypothetical protein
MLQIENKFNCIELEQCEPKIPPQVARNPTPCLQLTVGQPS